MRTRPSRQIAPTAGDDDPARGGAPATDRTRLRIAVLVALAAAVAFGAGALAVSAITLGRATDTADGTWTVVAIAVPLLLVPLVAGIAWLAVGSLVEEPLPAAVGPRPTGGALDPQTGLPGHRAFQEDLADLLASGDAEAPPLSLVLLDVDDFKRVNDAAGHATGDALLAELASLLARGLRSDDRAYRIGGDEFALLVLGQDAENAAIAVRRVLASVLVDRVEGAYTEAFSFSAGVASTAHRRIDRDVLHAHASTALDHAKRDGRCAVRVWAGGEDDETSQRGVRSAAVLGVLASGGLRPMYQPMVELTSGRVIAFEGLVRPPTASMFRDTSAMFLAAEEAGRIIELDLACIAAVLAGARDIGPDQSISLNLSPRTLEAPEFGVAAFVRRLALARWSPDRVIVELTERDGVEDIERIRRVMADLRAQGIRVAADDVGAGNAGLRLLSQIHFDIVKLDLSLVQGGLKRDTSLAVVRSIADLAARWDAAVVAEGVETPEQLRLIRRLGLTAAQGFLVGPPRPAPDARVVDLDGLESLAEDEEEGEVAGSWVPGPSPA